MEDTKKKFHLSMRVKNITSSVEFYGRLLGVPPTKMYHDYAKFELDHPAVVLTLESSTGSSDQKLNHLGIKLQNKNELMLWASKLLERGMKFESLDGVNCCYANQSKLYLNDPDGTLVEIYLVNADIEKTQDSSESSPQVDTANSLHSMDQSSDVYDHTLPNVFPKAGTIPASSKSKIGLRGSLNAQIPKREAFEILSESFRMLKNGGELTLHMLCSDGETLNEIPQLPEPAAAVRKVPSIYEVYELVREVGFKASTVERLSANPVFSIGPNGLREFLLKAYKTNEEQNDEKSHVAVIYLGPFERVELESGLSFTRLQEKKVGPDIVKLIHQSSMKNMFGIMSHSTQKGNSCS